MYMCVMFTQISISLSPYIYIYSSIWKWFQMGPRSSDTIWNHFQSFFLRELRPLIIVSHSFNIKLDFENLVS